MDKQRQEAENAIRLMDSTVRRKRALEEKRSGTCLALNIAQGKPNSIAGLIIVEANYGRLDEADRMIDVAIPMQYLVEDSQLVIPEGTTKVKCLTRLPAR